MFGLKNICTENGLPIPELFTDPAYAKLNHIILSTSTLSHECVQLGGFGPVVPDGFGIGKFNDENNLDKFLLISGVVATFILESPKDILPHQLLSNYL